MSEDIILKIKEREALEVLKFICIIYGLFLFVLGVTLQNGEAVIQVTFIMVFAIIIDMLNFGEIVVSEKELRSKNIKAVKYKDVYRTELQDRTLILYINGLQKPYRINFTKNEDYAEIQKAYKYIDSRVKEAEIDKKEHE